MAKGKSLLIGFLVGGSVAAVATLLSAPSSGKVLRQQVREQSADWKNTMNKFIQDVIHLKDQITKTSKEGIELIGELTKDMKSSIEEWKVSVEPHQENIHQYLEQIETSIKELEDKLKDTKQD
ncbi:YtxH domain-containing protein [Ornithinibacillus sp. 4-3]|uniref:YtxH domain-containing protein n=1 Tax=Ornithinibacillus sp. 4-3 TaxID=3231488 RepID=A0AB39HTR2_9BACI